MKWKPLRLKQLQLIQLLHQFRFLRNLLSFLMDYVKISVHTAKSKIKLLKKKAQIKYS